MNHKKVFFVKCIQFSLKQNKNLYVNMIIGAFYQLCLDHLSKQFNLDGILKLYFSHLSQAPYCEPHTPSKAPFPFTHIWVYH